MDAKQEGKIFYNHFRTRDHGAVTVAIEEVAHGEIVEHLIGYAFCAPRDQFTKKLGCTIARGRRRTSAQKFEGNDLFDLAKQTVTLLAETRRDFDVQYPMGKEPPIPRWFPEFFQALEREQLAREEQA